jgi:hypothetical protein
MLVRMSLHRTSEMMLDSCGAGRHLRRMSAVHTPDELRELLLELIVGAAGGDEAKWRKALGEVEKLLIAFNAQWNWAVHPTGTKAQKEVIANAVDLVREQHRYVAKG